MGPVASAAQRIVSAEEADTQKDRNSRGLKDGPNSLTGADLSLRLQTCRQTSLALKRYQQRRRKRREDGCLPVKFLQTCFQAGRGFETYGLARLDLDRGACLWVAPHTSSTITHGPGSKSG